MTTLHEGRLDGSKSLTDMSVGEVGTDSHVTNAEILGLDIFVKSSSNDGTVGLDLGEKVGSGHTIGVANSGKSVGRYLGTNRDQRKAHGGDSSLEGETSLAVLEEDVLNSIGGQLLERHIKGRDEVDSGSGEVRWTTLLVGLHDGKPLLHVSKVAGNLGGSVVEHVLK